MKLRGGNYPTSTPPFRPIVLSVGTYNYFYAISLNHIFLMFAIPLTLSCFFKKWTTYPRLENLSLPLTWRAYLLTSLLTNVLNKLSSTPPREILTSSLPLPIWNTFFSCYFCKCCRISFSTAVFCAIVTSFPLGPVSHVGFSVRDKVGPRRTYANFVALNLL